MITNESAKLLFSKAFGMSLAQSYKDHIHEGSNEKASLFWKWLAAEQ